VPNSKLEFSRGDNIAGKYEVLDLLDESPLGVTYRVKHLKTGKYVRLMLLSPRIAGREKKDDIIRAFKTAKATTHPHLIKVGELGEHDGVAYVTLEDFEGTPLRELLQEYKIGGRQFAVKEAAQITTQILEALGACHETGSVLRALRPEYVLVKIRHTGPRRQTFVAQTKVLGNGFWDLVPSAILAEDEFTRGEAQYIAPEMKSFEPIASACSDVYSAGVIFYEMLVGTAPVGTFQLPKTRRPDLPSHVNNVVELALAQAPDDRYQSAYDFLTDIQRTFQDPTLADTVERKAIIGPLGWTLALVAVALVAIIVWNLRPDEKLANEAADSQLRADVMERHSKPTPGEVASILEKHPDNMAYVPPGPFISGRIHSEKTTEGARISEPLAVVHDMDGYLIDMFEFKNVKGALPVYNVNHIEAKAFCESVNKRLCSDLEWEKACKGPQNNVYSYGDTYDEEFCGAGVEDPYKSGAKADCKSRWGVFDMSGSFREWTDSPPNGKQNRRIVKGGLKSNPIRGTRCAMTTDEGNAFKDTSLSFRCCRDADAAPIKPADP
jgi:serine/threonine protein kinase